MSWEPNETSAAETVSPNPDKPLGVKNSTEMHGEAGDDKQKLIGVSVSSLTSSRREGIEVRVP